jgi:hypothetical protein
MCSPILGGSLWTMPYILRADGTRHDGRMIQADPAWRLRLAPTDLTFIRIDGQTRLQFDKTEVVIESEFTLTSEGVEHHLDPFDRANLGPLLVLWPDPLESGSVDVDGTLRLVFASGATIAVPPDEHGEAWQVNGPDYLVVCVPGSSGDLAIWD